LIQVLLDDEPAHAGRLRTLREVDAVNRSSRLKVVAGPVAVWILVGVKIDCAYERRIVRHGIG
jgi:hypothetical protein